MILIFSQQKLPQVWESSEKKADFTAGSDWVTPTICSQPVTVSNATSWLKIKYLSLGDFCCKFIWVNHLTFCIFAKNLKNQTCLSGMKYQSDMKTYIKQMVPGCYIGCIVNSTTNIDTAVLLDGAKLLLTWNESKTNKSLNNIYTVNPEALNHMN